MLNADNATLEWCAQWIEDALKSETNDRTLEFGRNMVMTIRAVRTPVAVPVGEADKEVLKLCRLALMSLPVEALGRDEMFGHFYRDELLSEVNRVLAATLAPKPAGKCVKCGHVGEFMGGRCTTPVQRDNKTWRYCACKCEFSVPAASEE